MAEIHVTGKRGLGKPWLKLDPIADAYEIAEFERLKKANHFRKGIFILCNASDCFITVGTKNSSGSAFESKVCVNYRCPVLGCAKQYRECFKSTKDAITGMVSNCIWIESINDHQHVIPAAAANNNGVNGLAHAVDESKEDPAVSSLHEWGIDPRFKAFILECLNKNLRNARGIRESMLRDANLGGLERPTAVQINNFIQNETRKYLGIFDLLEITHICHVLLNLGDHGHQFSYEELIDVVDDLLVSPEVYENLDWDTPFVFSFIQNLDEVKLHGAEIKFSIAITTKRLLLFAPDTATVHGDASYKVSWQGYPILMLGTSCIKFINRFTFKM